MGIEPTKDGCRPSPVLKTGAPTRNAYASPASRDPPRRRTLRSGAPGRRPARGPAPAEAFAQPPDWYDAEVARRQNTTSALRAPVVLTGFGLGAFLDGIVLHQVLQWHHLVVEYRSADDLAGLEHNTLWDGLFHLVAWVVVLVGVLWAARRRAHLPAAGLRPVVGWLLIGWGSFNIVDQVVFHLLLEAHHIRMVEDYQVYDWGYTALGAVLIVVGVRLAPHGARAASA